jgi:hypothetical protein
MGAARDADHVLPPPRAARTLALATLGGPPLDAALEKALDRRIDARSECTFDHSGLTERRDLHPRRREGEQIIEMATHRAEQSRVGSDAATEHDEWEVERRRKR